MIKAVIFDMDGVLIDTEPLSDRYYTQFFKTMGFSATFLDFESLRGANGHRFWTYFVEKYSISYPTEEFKLKTRLGFIDFLKEQKVTPIPGVVKLLGDLQKKKFKLALASSASNIRISKLLKLTKLSKYFKTIVSGEEVIHSKPHPEIYLKAARKLGINPINCLAIEDSTSGIVSAKKAGMRVVGYKPESNNQNVSNADIIIKSFEEINIETLLMKIG